MTVGDYNHTVNGSKMHHKWCSVELGEDTMQCLVEIGKTNDKKLITYKR